MRVHRVNKARKDNRAVKKGEPYYWWKFRGLGKQYSATYPRHSQLCRGRNGAFYAALEAFEDSVGAAEDNDGLLAAKEDCASELEGVRDEYQEGFDNIPESLQEAPVGETMQEAIQEIDALIDNIQSWEPDDDWDFEDNQDGLRELAGDHCFPY